MSRGAGAPCSFWRWTSRRRSPLRWLAMTEVAKKGGGGSAAYPVALVAKCSTKSRGEGVPKPDHFSGGRGCFIAAP